VCEGLEGVQWGVWGLGTYLVLMPHSLERLGEDDGRAFLADALRLLGTPLQRKAGRAAASADHSPTASGEVRRKTVKGVRDTLIRSTVTQGTYLQLYLWLKRVNCALHFPMGQACMFASICLVGRVAKVGPPVRNCPKI
jgi:hypothetical protein